MNRRLAALAADVAAILLFVVLGRRSHDEGDGVGSALGVAAPFLIGLAVGWLVSPRVRRAPRSLRAGVDVWLATVVIGVPLRWFVWDRSTPVSFVLVAAAFLGLFLLGWRLVVSAASRRGGEIRSQRPPLEAER